MSETKIIKFDYDPQAAREVVLWFLNKHGGKLDILKLVKLIFLADREHLFRYGRTIVGGFYVAMQHGPVPSNLYDDLKDAKQFPDKHPYDFSGEYQLTAKESFDEDEFSESELEILEMIDSEFGKMDPFKLRDLTHELKAYQKNYPDINQKTSNPMSYEDFFLDTVDKDMLDLILEDVEVKSFFE